jgi:Domain of unknown function (DUF4331)
MSSHREAPEISKDPVADNTDTYAFVSPDNPSTVTLIANFIPLQQPDGGPNFYEFGDEVLYEIHVSNMGDAIADVTYQFRFNTTIRNPNTFLYNTGQITSINSPNWNRPQYYSVTRVDRSGRSRLLGSGLTVPPVNVGVRSTPNYDKVFTQAAVHSLGGGRRVFAGQRADAFHVDLGSIFDLGALRPFEGLHLINMPGMAGGVNSVQGTNVHSIAIQVPKSDVTRYGKVTSDTTDPVAVIGVWASASRQQARVRDGYGHSSWHGPWMQVSRLGNPLFNEVVVPMAKKDQWNSQNPNTDSQFAQYVTKPELAGLLPVLYPGAFLNLAAYTKPRADLAAILLTGIPAGIVSKTFQNYTGPVQADMLRLNVAVAPLTAKDSGYSNLGVVGGDLSGYPNGRRLDDDVVTIEIRAIAGVTIPLVDPSFTPDADAAAVDDGTTNTNAATTGTFPYLGAPGGGFQQVPGTATA